MKFCCIILKSLKTIALVCLLPQVFFGQTTNFSPYTRYGLGDLSKFGFAQYTSMGDATIALSDPFAINPGNPASYTALAKPVFELGIKTEFLNLDNGVSNQSRSNAALRNIALGIPISKKWGMSFGLIPYSSVGYRIESSEEVEEIGTVDYRYEGFGGLNQFYLGNAFDIIDKNDSTVVTLGMNAAYLFGSLDKYRRVIFQNDNFFNTRTKNAFILSDVKFDFGLNLRQQLKKNKKLLAGLYFGMGSEVNARNTAVVVTYEDFAGFESIKDTVSFSDEQKGSVSIPARLGLGLGLEIDNKWLIAMDYRIQNWSDFTTNFTDDVLVEGLKNSSQLSVGAQYKPQSIYEVNTGFLNRLTYRMGFRYASTYLSLKETDLNDYGISFGVGIPAIASFSRSRINLGAELGNRGTTQNGLIEERYVQVFFGLILSPHKADNWFYKRKYD